jgi:hypothetical protein
MEMARMRRSTHELLVAGRYVVVRTDRLVPKVARVKRATISVHSQGNPRH